ncbi:MAG: rod shape-determining protein MreB [Clostridia bacterium]|nr:rod shape-determining protein MreB [Clostridia bacterium]MBQ8333985.1 rod shape-determining protein MreB [Clostridia bacterium]MBQ8370590.1 rod shape-determining protein MreB [Clostridia bacterium]MBQ8512692.1 rod shape-determining protein MreB [Clostridia bacterium]
MSKDIGIDLGTATVLVYVKGKGIVIKEPSVVAIDKNTDKILKVGAEAEVMLGRTPGNITAIRPLRDGVISQYEITQHMIRHFIKKACGTMIFKPRVIICVPSGITEVEERAVVDAATQAGAKRTYLIEEPVAAALGAGIDISAPNGHMVVDIGGGTTDIAVISLGGVVVSESIKVAGDKFDEAIIRYCRRKHNVLIGERTAEEIKKKIGSAWPREEARALNVKGRCLIQGLPRMIHITSQEIPDALEEPITAVIEAVCSVIERTPPELIGDIISNGIVMTGGGSLLYGLDRLIEYATGVKTRVAKKAVSCVAIGTGKSLERLSSVPEGAVNISRHREREYTWGQQ